MVYLSYKKAPKWFLSENVRWRPKLAKRVWQERRTAMKAIRKHNKDPEKELRKQYSGNKSYPLYFARKILKYENPYDKKKSKYDKELFDEYLKKEKTRLKRKRGRRRYRHK
jgi:hypothetical protein